MTKRKRRAFTPAYKAEVVELIRASGKSIGAVTKDLGLTETAVRSWVRQAEIDGGGGGAVGALTSAERTELTDLRRRVKTLEMERDVLKKATAFFAKESK
jgi:transposase-like protein